MPREVGVAVRTGNPSEPRDVRLREVFRSSPELPVDVSPKVLAVRNSINR